MRTEVKIGRLIGLAALTRTLADPRWCSPDALDQVIKRAEAGVGGELGDELQKAKEFIETVASRFDRSSSYSYASDCKRTFLTELGQVLTLVAAGAAGGNIGPAVDAAMKARSENPDA